LDTQGAKRGKPEQHLAQAERNRELAEGLAASADYDWAVTALFYSALHLVQAYSLTQGAIVSNHSERARWMRGRRDMTVIAEDYHILRGRSEDARYDCRNFSGRQYEDLREHEFDQVSRHIASLLRR
jgi:uncharacterized protein (UPF0332 family)